MKYKERRGHLRKIKFLPGPGEINIPLGFFLQMHITEAINYYINIPIRLAFSLNTSQKTLWNVFHRANI